MQEPARPQEVPRRRRRRRRRRQRQRSSANIPESAPESAQDRLNRLREHLWRRGLPLRPDSRFCQKYLQTGTPPINVVTQRVAEALYLHEYCDYERGTRLALTLQAQRPDVPMWRLIQAGTLAHTTYGSFPPVWPWEAQITPYHWRTWTTYTPTLKDVARLIASLSI